MRFSRLQRVILLLALSNPDGGEVTPPDVKVAYYGFTLSPKGQKLLFSKSEIGLNRYNTASVIIARAFDHLARKGLAERRLGQGVRLTEKGREVARQIGNS